MIHRFTLTVPARAIDANGHANNVEYIRWMQDAAISHADAAGGSAAARAAGASWVVRSHHVEYLQPVFEKEAVTVLTWVSDVRRIRSRRKYLIFKNTTLAAKAETEWVFVDAKTGKQRPIPAAVSTTFTPVPPESEPKGWVA